jgi:hypothetical protein
MTTNERKTTLGKGLLDVMREQGALRFRDDDERFERHVGEELAHPVKARRLAEALGIIPRGVSAETAETAIAAANRAARRFASSLDADGR